VAGIDFSASTVEIAKTLTSGANPVFQKSSDYDIDFQDRFDVVIMFGVSCVACSNADDVRRVLQRIVTALKPRGRALFFEPLHRGFLRRILKMNLTEFTAIMTEAGFNVQETRNMHFWPTHLALASLPWPQCMTDAGYYFGQSMLAVLGHRAMGDYKFIRAVKADSRT